MTANVDKYKKFVQKGNFTKDERDSKFLAAMGLAGESGEVCDYLKKVLLHGKPLDRAKLVEELGDVVWYVFHTLNAFDLTLDEVIGFNVRKLCARYPEGYGTPSTWGIEDEVTEEQAARVSAAAGDRSDEAATEAFRVKAHHTTGYYSPQPK